MPAYLISQDSSGPATGLYTVTPHDSNDLSIPTRGLYVGSEGDVAVKPAYNSDSSVIFKNVPAGTLLPIVVIRVLSTGTTGADIVALY